MVRGVGRHKVVWNGVGELGFGTVQSGELAELVAIYSLDSQNL